MKQTPATSNEQTEIAKRLHDISDTLAGKINEIMEQNAHLTTKVNVYDVHISAINQRIDDILTFGTMTVGIVTLIVAVTGIILPLIASNNAQQASKKLQHALEKFDSEANDKFGEFEELKKSLSEIGQKGAAKPKKDSKSPTTEHILESLSKDGVGTRQAREKAFAIMQDNPSSDSGKIAKEIIFAAAYFAYETGLYDTAVQYYKKYIEKEPMASMAYNNLGLSYYMLKNILEAEKSYNKAIDIDPENTYALFNLGKLYLEKDAFDDALHYFQKVIMQAPQDVTGYNYAGITCEKSGEYEKALRYHWRAYNIAPQDILLRYNVIGGLLLNDDLEKAEEMAKEDEALTPNPHSAKILGHLKLLRGEKDKALTFYNKALGRYSRTSDKIEFLNQILEVDTDIGLKKFPSLSDDILEIENWAIDTRERLSISP